MGIVASSVIPLDPASLVPAIAQLASVGLFESFLALYTASFLRRRVEGLGSLVETHGGEAEAAYRASIRGLYSLRGILFAWVLLLSFFVPLFALGQSTPIAENLVGEIPYLYLNFTLATFFWVFGYSMYSIYRIGKLPLKLKPYTQDRTLGLKPFASASLRFTTIYLAIVTFLSAVIISGGVLPFTVSLLVLLFYPIGFLLFLLPLFSIHRKLVEAKSRELDWLEPRATAILHRLKADESIQIEQGVVNGLIAIDKIQRDIQQIHTWPFDTGVIVRLSAVIISLIAILLSALIRNLLGGVLR